MTIIKKLQIGEILVEEGILSKEQLVRALAEQRTSGQFLGELLVSRNLVSQEQLLGILAKRLGVRGCLLRPGLADPAMLKLVGEEEALRLKVLPMFKVRDTLTVAMAEPQSLPQIDRLRQLTNCTIRPVLALEANIIEFINKHAPVAGDGDSALSGGTQQTAADGAADSSEEEAVVDLDKVTESGAVVSLVNAVLLRAIREHASDIHIEPDISSTRVRCRVDGVLRELTQSAAGMHSAIISRVKVLAKMDISERRLPQEGRLRLRAQGRDIDLRISSMPTLLGEKIVVRILDKANLKTRMEELGFRPEALACLQRILRQPYGMVLVTGPTGSGKTTTLYSALEMLRGPGVNVVTVEEPVEYQLDMINQVQVQPAIGLTFARALRSILRQDPDVIMVGEIRDEETASVSVHAALTGHVVLATLHTNDAPRAIARLSDMGIAPYLLSDSLNGVVAQRLVRAVCPQCAAPCKADRALLAENGLMELADFSFSRGAGCDHCHGSGYSGRVGIYEVMEITPELRSMIHRRVSSEEMRIQWQKQGGLTLRQEALLLAKTGKTTLEEALSATYSDSPVGQPAAA
jgi:type IV pilus assembly protein PilB